MKFRFTFDIRLFQLTREIKIFIFRLQFRLKNAFILRKNYF